MCKGQLDCQEGSNTIWLCDYCIFYYDIAIQDSPLVDTTDFKLTPYSDLLHYPQFDADDPQIPFVEAIDLLMIIKK